MSALLAAQVCMLISGIAMTIGMYRRHPTLAAGAAVSSLFFIFLIGTTVWRMTK